MKMRTTLRICYATWWSFIRAWSITVKATNVPALVDVVSLLYCWRVSVWSELQQSNICFCCPSERHDGALCKRDDCGEMPGWQRLWWIWWVVARLLPDFEMNDCAESTSQCVCIRHASAQSRIKKPLLLNKPLAIIISFVFWLIANVPCIEEACMILSVYAE